MRAKSVRLGCRMLASSLASWNELTRQVGRRIVHATIGLERAG
jgi:hypothetical protein